MEIHPVLANLATVGQADLAPQRKAYDVIADKIEALSTELRNMSSDEINAALGQTTLLAASARIYSARRKVDEIFGLQGFAVSPGWDILLDLYRTRASSTSVSVTSACIGAACPPTTALRWLQALEHMKLVEREADTSDKRRSWVTLTSSGIVKVELALAAYV